MPAYPDDSTDDEGAVSTGFEEAIRRAYLLLFRLAETNALLPADASDELPTETPIRPPPHGDVFEEAATDDVCEVHSPILGIYYRIPSSDEACIDYERVEALAELGHHVLFREGEKEPSIRAVDGEIHGDGQWIAAHEVLDTDDCR